MGQSNWYLVSGITVVILLLSLAIYSRTYTGWTAQDSFDIDVTHTALGVPHWLIINDLEVKGTPPDIDARYLPEAERYQPGWHLRPLRLLASALLCLTIALPITWLLAKAQIPAGWGLYVAPVLLALVAGASIPTDPILIGVSLVLGLLPISLVAASALGRSYLFACVAGIATAIFLWASHRLADLFAEEHLVHGLPDENDLLGASVFVPVLLALALAATYVGRRIARPAPHNQRLQLTGDAHE